MKWRLLVGAAPIVGIALFLCAWIEGGPGLLNSPLVAFLLALLAACGAAVTGWTSRQGRRVAPQAVAGAAELARAGAIRQPVMLTGRARALPDAVPLVSPDGELCLWFRHGATAADACTSARPFLLVDASGECIVLPAGAQVTGRGSMSMAAARSGRARRRRAADAIESPGAERLLRSGDRVRVTGQFVADSLLAQALHIGEGGQGSFYGVLAVVDAAVLVFASVLVACSSWWPTR